MKRLGLRGFFSYKIIYTVSFRQICRFCLGEGQLWINDNQAFATANRALWGANEILATHTINPAF